MRGRRHSVHQRLSQCAKSIQHLLFTTDAMQQPVRDVLTRDAQGSPVFHQPDVVNVRNFGAADALVDPANHVAQYAFGVHPELWTNAMLDFPQSEENRGEEESLQRRTDCIDTARSRIEHGDGHGASAWGGRANDLSMAAAVLRHGGIGCPRAEAIYAMRTRG